jgi:hypothetical protein
MGSASWWRFELSSNDDEVSVVKPVAPGVGGLGRRLATGSHHVEHRVGPTMVASRLHGD